MPILRPRTITILLAAAGLGVLAVVGALLYPALREWWSGVQVVRTLDDLRGARPIDLGDGVTVRVGIEAREAPLWSGVLVYCLAEGYDPRIMETAHGGLPLGPLSIQVGDSSLVRRVVLVEVKKQLPPRSGRFFVQAVTVRAVGAISLRILGPKGDVVRHTSVYGTGERGPSWVPFSEATTLDKLFLRTPDDRFDMSTLVAVAPTGLAMPRCEGAIPMELPSAELPRLATLAPDERLRLARDANGDLAVEWSDPVSFPRIRERLLARWWVNGRPVVRRPHDPWSRDGWGRGGLETRGDHLRLEIELDPEVLGARSADRVELQLLYTDDGWEYGSRADSGAVMERLRPAEPSRHRFLLSNRVAWTLE